MKITHSISLDFQRYTTSSQINVVQDDTYSRYVAVSLYDNVAEWPVPDGATIAVRFKKPDKTQGVYDTLPNGEVAYSIDGNVVTVGIAPQMLVAKGKVTASAVIYLGSVQLATFPFVLNVIENPAAGKSVSRDYYYLSTFAAVNEAIGDLNNLQTSTKESLVAAINELAQGTVTEAEIQKAVDAYLEKNGTGSILVDSTLTKEGYAADAKATGDALSKLSGGNVDLTGYATKRYVNDYAQPKGKYLKSSELSNAVNTALAEAKASGEFDGPAGPQGEPGPEGPRGETGQTGAAGKTPVRGTDYWTAADQESIVQQVLDSIGQNVIGEVDSENNILITATLPNGTYTLKYENADGSVTDIGTFTVGSGGSTGSSYTNLADPTSSEWLTNKRINSSKNVVDVTEAQRGDKTVVVTNHIDITGVSKLHIKGLDIINNLVNGSSNQNFGRMYTYKDGAIHSSTYQPSSGISGKTHYTVADYDSSVTILDVATALNDWGYTGITQISLGGVLTGAASDVIITADENIV